MIVALERIPIEGYRILDRAVWEDRLDSALQIATRRFSYNHILPSRKFTSGLAQAFTYTAIAYILRRVDLVGVMGLSPTEKKFYERLTDVHENWRYRTIEERDKAINWEIEIALGYAERKIKVYIVRGANKYKYPPVALAQAYYNTFSPNT